MNFEEPCFPSEPLGLALLRAVEEPEQIVDKVGRLDLFPGLCHAETRLPDFGGRDSQLL